MGVDFLHVSGVPPIRLGRIHILTRSNFSEGIITVLVAFASFYMVQDFPDTAKFLTEPERAVVIARLQGDDQFSAAGEGCEFPLSVYLSISAKALLV